MIVSFVSGTYSSDLDNPTVTAFSNSFSSIGSLVEISGSRMYRLEYDCTGKTPHLQWGAYQRTSSGRYKRNLELLPSGLSHLIAIFPSGGLAVTDARNLGTSTLEDAGAKFV